MTEESFDLLMAKVHSEETSKEDESNKSKAYEQSDDDSDYGGSNGYGSDEEDPPTTNHMLFEKMLSRDIEFVHSCQLAGLISKSSLCPKCSTVMILNEVEHTYCPDGIEWLCPNCSSQKSVKEGSWFVGLEQTRLRDIISILYCWCRNYPDYLCQHEVDLRVVPLLYNKCYTLCNEYFNHAVSNIGAKGEVVEIEEFESPTGLHVIGGVERKNMKNVFFRVLPENWTRDDLVTAIADNVAPGSVLHFQNKTLLAILDDVGLKYLKVIWGLSVERKPMDSPMVTSLWTLFERLFKDKGYTENSLYEFLFRRRMEAAKDPFLFLLSIISILHPPS